MRFRATLSAMAIAFSFFSAAPAHATGMTFTGFACKFQLPCLMSDAAFPPPDKLASMTYDCVKFSMGNEAAEALLLDYGLNSEGCYDADSSKITSVAGTRTTPHCCIKPYGTNACIMRCSVVNEQ